MHDMILATLQCQVIILSPAIVLVFWPSRSVGLISPENHPMGGAVGGVRRGGETASLDVLGGQRSPDPVTEALNGVERPRLAFRPSTH